MVRSEPSMGHFMDCSGALRITGEMGRVPEIANGRTPQESPASRERAGMAGSEADAAYRLSVFGAFPFFPFRIGIAGGGILRRHLSNCAGRHIRDALGSGLHHIDGGGGHFTPRL